MKAVRRETTELDYNSLRERDFVGEFTATLTPASTDYFTKFIVDPGRKCVMSFDEKTMRVFKKLDSGAVIDFAITSGDEEDTKKYKVKRRDWKRSKVHLVSV